MSRSKGRFRGAPAAVRMHVALGYQDGMEIELHRGSGRWSEPLARGADGAPLIGMHHVAWFSETVAADVARTAARHGRVFRGGDEVTRVAYLEDRASLD